MLFNALYALMVVLFLLYLYGLVFKKQKNYYLSIMIRLLTLGLFALIVFDQHETQIHLATIFIIKDSLQVNKKETLRLFFNVRIICS